MEILQTIAAKTVYLSWPWQDVAIDQGLIRGGQVYQHVFDNPADTNARFWKDVRQLYFAFQQQDLNKIRLFYEQYGSVLGSHSRDCGDGFESFNEVRAALDWFRVLTVLTDQVKNKKLSQLREKFGQPREFTIDEVKQSKLTGQHVDQVYLCGSPGQFYWSISWQLWPDPRRSKLCYYAPRNNEQLILAAWEVIIQATADMLSTIPLTPLTETKQAPAILWGFRTDGALRAAFVQWYMQELAHINLTRCAAPGCPNIVPEGRLKWCSETCRQRVKKRSQRQKSKTLERSPGKG